MIVLFPIIVSKERSYVIILDCDDDVCLISEIPRGFYNLVSVLWFNRYPGLCVHCI